MADQRLLDMLRESLRRQRMIPPEERFAAMVRRGAIDETGKVLLQMPEPPGRWPEDDETNGDRVPSLDPPAL